MNHSPITIISPVNILYCIINIIYILYYVSIILWIIVKQLLPMPNVLHPYVLPLTSYVFPLPPTPLYFRNLFSSHEKSVLHMRGQSFTWGVYPSHEGSFFHTSSDFFCIILWNKVFFSKRGFIMIWLWYIFIIHDCDIW